MTDGTSKGMARDTALSVRDVTVHAGGRTLLDRVGFETRPGEIVAIIGPNGAGKTTLLEVITGLRTAATGVVTLAGATPRGFADRAQSIVFLPDEGELPPELCVREVVGHALRQGARPRGIVDELRSLLSVDPLLGTPVGVLSRGEHQRVALFCALAVERSLVVLDEPFEAFDPLKLRDVLRAVKRVADCGSAIVATVHHLADAARAAGRVLILSEGRAIAWGTLEELRERASLPSGSLEDVFVALLGRGSDAA